MVQSWRTEGLQPQERYKPSLSLFSPKWQLIKLLEEGQQKLLPTREQFNAHCGWEAGKGIKLSTPEGRRERVLNLDC